MGRSFCYQCHKAASQCICHLISIVENKTPIVILQHFRERFHPIGTARFAVLGLANCELHVAHSGLPGNSTSAIKKGGWKDRTLNTELSLPEGCAVLFPSSRAEPLTKESPPSSLLVLDATWSHARRLYYENPWIEQMRHVSLAPKDASRYLIRKEPARHCVSTLEAIILALKILEPETDGYEGLLSAFDAMIKNQSEFLS